MQLTHNFRLSIIEKQSYMKMLVLLLVWQQHIAMQH